MREYFSLIIFLSSAGIAYLAACYVLIFRSKWIEAWLRRSYSGSVRLDDILSRSTFQRWHFRRITSHRLHARYYRLLGVWALALPTLGLPIVVFFPWYFVACALAIAWIAYCVYLISSAERLSDTELASYRQLLTALESTYIPPRLSANVYRIKGLLLFFGPLLIAILFLLMLYLIGVTRAPA